MVNELIKFDEIKKQIDAARDIQTLNNLADKMERVKLLAKQSHQSLEVQNKVAIYRLRIDRKRGFWLKDNIRHQGGNPDSLKQFSDGKDTRPSVDVRLQDLDLTKDKSSKLQKMADLSNEEFEEYIEETKNKNEEVTEAGLVRMAKKIFREEKIEKQKEEIKSLKPTFNGVFDVIVIDPPWKYGTTYSPESPMGRVANPYPEMNQEELLNIKLPTANNCILWLWSTNGFMKDAYELAEHWGFEVKTILTWNKVNMGVGHWLRNVTEHCLLCVKGQPIWDNKTYTTLLTEKRTEHSKKPKSFYEMVDKICYGRKLEYFSRKQRKGWVVYGDEIEKDESS